jgi:hypothetical protein
VLPIGQDRGTVSSPRWLSRYQDGQRDEVWQELRQLGSADPGVRRRQALDHYFHGFPISGQRGRGRAVDRGHNSAVDEVGATSSTGRPTAAMVPRPTSRDCRLARGKLTVNASSSEYTRAAYAAASSPTLWPTMAVGSTFQSRHPAW